MKAIVATQFGGPDVLEARNVETPTPRATELLVRLKATSVNPVDYKIREQGGAFGLEAPRILGFDASGVVEAIGEEVTGFAPGDEVFYTADILRSEGCNAEYHAVDEAIVATKPKNLTHEQAAAIPLAGGTAWQALLVRGGLSLNDSVLIHGAGGVGAFAAQLAVAAGARVFVTCSDYMIDPLVQWGVDRAMDYKRENFVDIVADETGGEGVSLVFNTVGADLLTQSLPVTADFGVMLTILDTDGSLGGAYRKNVTLEFVMLQRGGEVMEALRRLAEREVLQPQIDSVVELDDVAEAHRRLQNGGVHGKIVVRIS